MSSICELCGDLNLKKPGWCMLSQLEKSSWDGCGGCTVLYRAVDVGLKEWHEPYSSDQFVKDAIEAHWQLSSSKNMFTVDVAQTESEGESRLLLQLRIHTAPGEKSPFGDIGSHSLIPLESNSSECTTKIKQWLRECQNDHPRCTRIKTEWTSRIPIPAKRVIDVGDDHRSPRLLEEKVLRGYYACLSHCWGTSTPLMTTKDTLKQRSLGLEFDELPKTFRDAIFLCRALGISYLWIDSLCIVQDDGKEWHSEAARMFEIYGNAYLTIAATAAPDSNHGLFSTRETSLQIPGTNIYVRRKMDHSAFRTPILSSDSDQASKYPLFTRGWCLQERLLSSRILHFTATEMVWQCRSWDLCECSGIQLPESPRNNQLLTSRLKYNRVVEGISGSDAWTIWREIVEDYTSTNLTKDSDYLPALSGVAAKFGLAGAGTYIAGLWHKPGALSLGSSPLFMDLLWKSAARTSRRPRIRCAPSFSWASRMGPISYRNQAREGPVIRYQNDIRDGKRKYVHKCIFVLQLIHAYDGSERYAAAANATMELRTQLIPCGIRIQYEGSFMVLLGPGVDDAYAFVPDVQDAVVEEADAECFVMPVAAYEHFSKEAQMFDGVVLAKVDGHRFRRIGLAECLSADRLSDDGHIVITLE